MAMTKRRIAVLGSTGSIGTQACEVAKLHEDRFEVVALTAYASKEKLFEQVRAVAAPRGAHRQGDIGFVFQFHHLLPEFTALENVMMPALIAGRSKQEAEKEALNLLKMMNLTERTTHKPSALSGGEQQRIVIARAILNKPELILADEPTGNLDVDTGRRIVELLKEICAQGSAILMITHNLNMLTEYPGKVFKFENHHIKEITAQYGNIFEQNA